MLSETILKKPTMVMLSAIRNNIKKTYYGYAIRNNIKKTYYGYAMRNNIKNGHDYKSCVGYIYHMIIDPPEEFVEKQHFYCPDSEDSWCQYKKDIFFG